MKLTVFFSWQTETEPQGFNNKKFLIDCISKCLKQIQDKGKLKGVFFELKEGLRGESGTPNVAEKMLELTDSCDTFIGDFTVVQKISKLAAFLSNIGISKNYIRKTPNSNVFGEFNRALGRYDDFYKQIILVRNTINGKTSDDDNTIPFDTRARRWPIEFELKNNSEKNISKASKKLQHELKDAIQLCAFAAIENNKRRYLPFIGWSEHNSLNLFRNKYYWNQTLEGYSQSILSSKIVRVIGLSGLGKTRLILETFRSREKDRSHYLYCNCLHHSKEEIISKLKYSILTLYPEAIIVLDNCDEEDFKCYVDLWKALGAQCKLIALFNNPEEKPVYGTVQCIIKRNLDDIIIKILSDRGFTKDQLIIIKEFAGGIPMMAELLVQGINDGETLGHLSDPSLISKILGINSGNRQRAILQSISLFDFIGWKNELRGEIEYVTTNSHITSVEYSDRQVFLNDVDKIIKKFIDRNILETRGRKIGLRPLPLALYLILEWMEECSQERLEKAIQAIQRAPHAEALVSAFHNQVKYLGFNSTAKRRLDGILDLSGPFASAEVINTEVGSNMLRTFAEITPEKTTQLLFYILKNENIENLKKFGKGRRNLIWLLEKLCFRNETFEEAAYLLMRFGIAENENYANNASNQFLSLFPVFLPATSVSLSKRIAFLESQLNNDENIPILIKAIERGLSISNHVFMHGPEKMGGEVLPNYEPETYSEIKEYLVGCLNILSSVSRRNVEYLMQCSEVLVKTFAKLCSSGCASIILPVIESFIERLDYNWDEMWDTMSMYHDSHKKILKADEIDIYDRILDKIRKEDIISRFRRVQKESITNPRDFNKSIEIQHENYKKLAIEFIDKEGYSKATLRQLMLLDVPYSIPFGQTMASCSTKELRKKILTDAIDILNSASEANPLILINFINGISELEFDEWFDIIKNIIRNDVLFGIVGYHGLKPKNQHVDYLVSLVKKGEAQSSSFYNYFTSLNQSEVGESELITFFKEILNLTNGIDVVIQICSSYLFFNSRHIDAITQFIEETVLKQSEPQKLFERNGFLEVLNRILARPVNEDFVKYISNALMAYIKDDSGVFSSSYQIEELFSVLLQNHFEEFWPILSTGLIGEGEEYLLFFKLKNILYRLYDGATLLDVDKHGEELKAWCAQNPRVAPARLISLISWTGDDSGFSKMTKFLIDNYGDSDEMLQELSATMGSFSSSGSVLPYYDSRIKTLEGLLNHSNANVREWAKREIIGLRKSSESAKIFEDEQ